MKIMHSKRKMIVKLVIACAVCTAAALIVNPINAAKKITPVVELKSSEGNAQEWLNTLKGKNVPVVYEMHEHKDFWAGIWSNIYLMTNQDIKNVGVVLVMMHVGFPFALNDAMFQ